MSVCLVCVLYRASIAGRVRLEGTFSGKLAFAAFRADFTRPCAV